MLTSSTVCFELFAIVTQLRDWTFEQGSWSIGRRLQVLTQGSTDEDPEKKGKNNVCKMNFFKCYHSHIWMLFQHEYFSREILQKSHSSMLTTKVKVTQSHAHELLSVSDSRQCCTQFCCYTADTRSDTHIFLYGGNILDCLA